MVYRATITTDANTARTSPKDTTLQITNGLIFQYDLLFPSGSAGLLGVRILDGAYQFAPTSFGEWFRGDDIYFQYDDLYVKDSEPFELSIETYNLDEAYEHMVIVSVSLVSKEEYQARYLPSVAYKEFQKVYEEVLKQQEARKVQVLQAGLPLPT